MRLLEFQVQSACLRVKQHEIIENDRNSVIHRCGYLVYFLYLPSKRGHFNG